MGRFSRLRQKLKKERKLLPHLILGLGAALITTEIMSPIIIKNYETFLNQTQPIRDFELLILESAEMDLYAQKKDFDQQVQHQADIAIATQNKMGFKHDSRPNFGSTNLEMAKAIYKSNDHFLTGCYTDSFLDSVDKTMCNLDIIRLYGAEFGGLTLDETEIVIAPSTLLLDQSYAYNGDFVLLNIAHELGHAYTIQRNAIFRHDYVSCQAPEDRFELLSVHKIFGEGIAEYIGNMTLRKLGKDYLVEQNETIFASQLIDPDVNPNDLVYAMGYFYIKALVGDLSQEQQVEMINTLIDYPPMSIDEINDPELYIERLSKLDTNSFVYDTLDKEELIIEVPYLIDLEEL